ncbi:MAG: class I SAM-dependent methyltransferase [Chloroflexi bacterium]|nr:class I SAM-dependent methyltransferase [Chloroflexota bacterium]
MAELPQPCSYLLDVACGEGRLGRFLLARQAIRWYTGVDFSARLLNIAQELTMGISTNEILAGRAACMGWAHLMRSLAWRRCSICPADRRG